MTKHFTTLFICSVLSCFGATNCVFSNDPGIIEGSGGTDSDTDEMLDEGTTGLEDTSSTGDEMPIPDLPDDGTTGTSGDMGTSTTEDMTTSGTAQPTTTVEPTTSTSDGSTTDLPGDSDTETTEGPEPLGLGDPCHPHYMQHDSFPHKACPDELSCLMTYNVQDDVYEWTCQEFEPIDGYAGTPAQPCETDFNCKNSVCLQNESCPVGDFAACCHDFCDENNGEECLQVNNSACIHLDYEKLPPNILEEESQWGVCQPS